MSSKSTESVDRFELSDDDQDRLVAIGELGIERRSIGEMNLQISTSQFKVLDNQFGDMQIDSDVRVTGAVAKPTVTGEIITRPARLEVDQILEQLSRNPYSTEAMVTTITEGIRGEGQAEITPSTSPLTLSDNPQVGVYDAATIDVRLRLPDDLLLRGRDMHASFRGLAWHMNTRWWRAADSQGACRAARCDRTVTVVRGFYDFQGRRSNYCGIAKSGSGDTSIDPALQVDAQRLISGSRP